MKKIKLKMRFAPLGIYIILLVSFEEIRPTIDINFSEYQYLADHLTEKQCHELVAALYFKDLEIPRGLAAAEDELPRDVPCVELLLLWNSTPNAGKGKTQIWVCLRLNQIGRPDLAIWLTRAVFHQLSEDLKNSMTLLEIEESTKKYATSKSYEDEEIFLDEAEWWKFDTFLCIVLVFAVVSLFVQVLILCYLKATKKSNIRRDWLDTESPIE